MFTPERVRSALVLLLAVVFYAFFMVAKHNWLLARVNVFGDDPYDAVGSFGVQAAGLLGLLAALRSLRREPSERESVLLLRTQASAVLAVAVTLAADLAALARWTTSWSADPAGWDLAAFVAGMVLLTALTLTYVLRAAPAAVVPTARARNGALLLSLIALAVAISYPTSWREGIFGALATVIVGVLLLFVPMWAWGRALLPYPPLDTPDPPAAREKPSQGKWLGWALVVVLGLALGGLLVFAESTDGGAHPPVMLRLFVIAIYLGLETGGLLIGFAFLRRYLRLLPSR